MTKADVSRIIIIDDDATSVEMGVSLLEKQGYIVEYASDASTGLEMVQSRPYDLILLDIVMPDMTGLEVAQRLRQDEKTKDIPIIFLTAQNDPESMVAGFEAGGNEYITKPFHSLELMVRVKNQLDLADYRNKLKQMNLHLEDMLKERTDQLVRSERQAAFAQVIQGIIHNLKSPLMVIKASVDLFHMTRRGIEKEGGLAMQSQERLLDHFQGVNRAMERIQSAANRINQMVNSLLAKGSTARSADMETFDLNKLILEELEFYSVNLNYKRFNSKYIYLSKDELRIKGIRGILSQVFANILQNALDELRSVKDPELVVKSGKEGRFVFFSVKDNGHGIPAEWMDRIFDPFFTTKPKTATESDDGPVGVGLGLHFCQKAVKEMGGDIRVFSKEGEGTEFMVLLPQCE